MIFRKFLLLGSIVLACNNTNGQLNNCDSMNYKFLSSVRNAIEKEVNINGRDSTIIYYDNLYNICFEKKRKFAGEAESFYVDYSKADSVFSLKDKKKARIYCQILRGVDIGQYINSIKPWSYKLENGCNFGTGNYTQIFIQCPIENWEEFYSNSLFSDTLILTTKISVFYRKGEKIMLTREFWELQFINNRFVVISKKKIFKKSYVCK